MLICHILSTRPQVVWFHSRNTASDLSLSSDSLSQAPTMYSRDESAPFAERGVDERPRIAQATTAGTGYMQTLAYATPPFLFEASQVLMPAIPRQHQLDAVVPPDDDLQADKHIPSDISPFRSSYSQQAPINSLPTGFSVAHDPYPTMIHQSLAGHYTQQMPSSAANRDRNTQIDSTSFALARFPLQNADHLQKRQSVVSIINSEWWIRNTIEPEERFLLQFMNYDTHEERWKCCFWEEGNPCQRSCKGKDHAKGHVRFHLQHFPFACEPPW
jgi:hypothetical protein